MERYFLDPSGLTYCYLCRIINFLPSTAAEGVLENDLEGAHMGM
jgi:hypothetical protein